MEAPCATLCMKYITGFLALILAGFFVLTPVAEACYGRYYCNGGYDYYGERPYQRGYWDWSGYHRPQFYFDPYEFPYNDPYYSEKKKKRSFYNYYGGDYSRYWWP